MDKRSSLWINVRKLVTHNGQGRYRKLTLNDFPMEYGVKDVQQRSLTSRQERSRLQDRLQSARKESGTLREYSRRRFQNVVDWEARDSPQPTEQIKATIHTPSRPKTTACTRPVTVTHPPLTPTTPTNGPTKDGSILYNGKPLLLSAIRTRPNSEPPGRFDHLRGAHAKNYPYIQRTLEQSNCEYRVGATPCSTAREDRREGALSPDFVMLIPVTSQVSDVTEEDRLSWQKGQAWLEDAPLLASTARSRSPRSEEGSEGRTESGVREREEHGEAECSGNDAVSGRDRPGKAEPPDLQTAPDSSGGPSQPGPPPSHHGHTPVTQKTLPQATIVTTPTTQPASSSPRTQSARSEMSSMSCVSISPRPHCWVDDVTVSSDESLVERELSVHCDLDARLSTHSQDPASKGLQLGLAAQAPRMSSPSGEKKKGLPITKRVSSPLLKKAPSGGKGKAAGCPRSLKQSTASGSKAGAKSATGEVPEVKEGEEVAEEEEEVVLPRFACPSSESKSRQAAIKEWLAKTSFATACRTVPLM